MNKSINRVLNFLSEYPEKTFSEIRKNCKIDDGYLCRILRKLIEEKRIAFFTGVSHHRKIVTKYYFRVDP